MNHSRCSIHCILPPVVLEHVIRNGDDEQRAWAARAVDRSQSIRLARVQNMKVRAGGPREGADALAVAAEVRPSRQIRDARGREQVSVGPIVRKEGDPATGDPAVDEAYEFFGDTFKFGLDVYGRNSIDDAGMPLRGVVHFGDAFPNAFWDGKRMVFGDGDGQILGRMTKSLDVIGHELGHGVVEDESGLEYFGQSGALNEHFADVWGSLVKQYRHGQTAAQADWTIGSEVWSPDIDGDALRSLKAPGSAYNDPLVGKDPQPASMADYIETFEDNGGVHLNSGIPNHAFYTTAIEIGGKAWEETGLIWYEALQHPACKPNTDFARFARITQRVAARLFGKTSSQAMAVHAGWEKVGIADGRPGR